ncbi:MAG: hypothetical protein EVB11_10785 [Winogradskyella sp.]|nr:MAG: hypothetical protein EVB11_10785 [Winogradskyella sp.]
MIGILLALQVNNWNNENKDRISERKILDNIHRDFLTNKVRFDSLKAIHYRSAVALDSMIALFPLNGDSVKIKAFREHSKGLKEIRYNASSSTIETVVSSNSLELIRNEELHKYLMSWEDALLDFLEEENSYFSLMHSVYWPHALENYDYTGKDKDLNNKFYSGRKYQNLIISRRNRIGLIIKAFEEESIENHINEIIRLTKPITRE